MKIDGAADQIIINRYMEMLDRRVKNEPVQYIAGSWEFMSLEFLVSHETLIPRQDTEILVEHLIGAVKGSYRDKLKSSGLSVLDLCTGSGCIAVSLKHYLKDLEDVNNSKDVRVTGVDISSGAIGIARKNAIKNGLGDSVRFIECDLFDRDALDRLFETTGAVDIICANPPYIPTSQLGGLMPDVRDYEPLAALDGGAGGLDFYKLFAEAVLPGFLAHSGFAAFEVGAGQAGQVIEIFEKKFPIANIYSVMDLAKIERVVCIEQVK
jgi:release factor glutamine methyltransferase